MTKLAPQKETQSASQELTKLTPQEEQVWNWLFDHLKSKSKGEASPKEESQIKEPEKPNFTFINRFLFAGVAFYVLILASVLFYVFWSGSRPFCHASTCNNTCFLLVTLMLIATLAVVGLFLSIGKYRQLLLDNYNKQMADFYNAVKPKSDPRHEAVATKMIEIVLSGIGEKIKAEGQKASEAKDQKNKDAK